MRLALVQQIRTMGLDTQGLDLEDGQVIHTAIAAAGGAVQAGGVGAAPPGDLVIDLGMQIDDRLQQLLAGRAFLARRGFGNHDRILRSDGSKAAGAS